MRLMMEAVGRCDCEYPNLCTRILGFLGEEVPSTSHPAKYVRFIYNRLILENALVRAAAVDALSKIAMKCTTLRKDVLLLLQFGANDNDDEVRDRIKLYSNVLKQCVEETNDVAKVGYETLMSADTNFSVDALYESLVDQMQNGSMHQIIDFGNLPSAEAYAAAAKAKQALEPEKKKPGAPPAPKAAAAPQDQEQRAASSSEMARVVSEILGDGDLGPLQHSCKPKPLTENEAEYTVQVIKHMFAQHLVLEMYVSNTVQGITLEEVQVNLTGLEPGWSEVGASAINKLEFGQNGSAHVVLRKNGGEDGAGVVSASLGASLRFIVKEEGDDLGYEDDYPVENVTISTGDYMFPRGLQSGQFRSVWEQLTAQGTEVTQKLSLNFKTLEMGVDWIIATLNMQPCDNTGKVEQGGRGHTVLLSGTFLGGQTCLVKALVGMDAERGCVARVSARAKSADICQVVLQVAVSGTNGRAITARPAIGCGGAQPPRETKKSHQVDVGKVEVNVNPFLLHILRSHLPSYDPNVRFSSSSSSSGTQEPKGERRPLPKLVLTLKTALLRLWIPSASDGSENDLQGPKLRLYLNMLELTTVKSMVVGVGAEEAEGVVRVKLRGLLGDGRAKAGGCSVFACSSLEGCETFQHPPVLELRYAWTSDRTQITLATASLQVSPTQGLLDGLHLLLPIFQSKRPLPAEGAASSESIPPEYAEGEERPSAKARADQASTPSLRLRLTWGCISALPSTAPPWRARTGSRIPASRLQLQRAVCLHGLPPPTWRRHRSLIEILSFWSMRKGCKQPELDPDRRVMGNPMEGFDASGGGPPHHYMPGSKHEILIETPSEGEHLLWVTAGQLEPLPKEDDDDDDNDDDDVNAASLKCNEQLAAWGLFAAQRKISWTAPSRHAGQVNITMLTASSYGPVDFYQVALAPVTGHDL
eukprot:s728_g2.t1